MTVKRVYLVIMSALAIFWGIVAFAISLFI